MRRGFFELAFCERVKFSNRPLIHILFLAAAGLIIYSNTLDVPFQWDEQRFIEENPAVRDLSYFFHPSKAQGSGLYGTFISRYVGYLTFALNYKLNGLDVRGYHIFNLFVHVLNALLIYSLLVLVFRSPFLSESPLKDNSRYVAFFTALLFVCHPVETEAVTYIYQRFASLEAFFYLLALVLYAAWRLGGGGSQTGAVSGRRSALLYPLSLLSVLLAMKTKENAFTLPLVIALFEFFFFAGPARGRVLRLIPFLLAMFIIPLTLLFEAGPVRESMGPPAVSGEEYLFTEMRVLVTYIRLLFLPVGQNVDYDYPVYRSFLEPEVFVSFFLLLFIFGTAFFLFCRSRFRDHLPRLASFGILWFLITLSVESSIMPLPILIDEYRLYLPSVGVFMAVITGAFLLLERLENRTSQRIIIAAVILVPFMFSVSAYIRNGLWSSQISLWQDVVDKSPRKARGHNNLGLSYLSKGLTEKAIEEFRAALSLDPDYIESYNNLCIAYRDKGLYNEAIEQCLRAVELKPGFAEAHNDLGRAYEGRGLPDKAVKSYLMAVKLRPDFAEAHNNLGIAYGSMGMYEKAIEHYIMALGLKPENTETRFNLGLIYLEKGQMEEARKEFEQVLGANPHHRGARKFLEHLRGKGGACEFRLDSVIQKKGGAKAPPFFL